MEESVTYQAIIAKGRALGRFDGTIETFRKVLLRLGQDRFGKPGARVKAAIQAMDDPDELERLSVRVLHAASWDELLSLPKTRRRS